jgi:ZIP family zinc transporter
MDAMLGFAAGVMTAASFFSLLAPAIEHAQILKMTPWLIVTIGFFCGGLILFVSDKIFNKLLNKKNKRILMLVSSITIHNIPEGLAVGIAFGSVYYGLTGATTLSALMLAIGIGLQNFPEGSAVSIPLRRDGMSRKKAFFYGQLSAVVEPIFGVLGAILVLKARTLLPFFLSFAAGAMIYVVISELIPESQSNEKKDIMAIFTIIGFSIMMILDVALG